MKTKQTFAESFRIERKRRALTQAQAATLCNVSPRAVWEWENGQEPLEATREGILARLRADMVPVAKIQDALTPDEIAKLLDAARTILKFVKRISPHGRTATVH
jgi:transcriptional regulator with XRE-family HTH domain